MFCFLNLRHPDYKNKIVTEVEGLAMIMSSIFIKLNFISHESHKLVSFLLHVAKTANYLYSEL